MENTFDAIKKLHRIQYITIQNKDALEELVFEYIVGTCDDIINFLEESDTV